jgi:hypothetical protein
MTPFMGAFFAVCRMPQCITIHEFVCRPRGFSCSGGSGERGHAGLLYRQDRLDGYAACCADLMAVCFLHLVNQTLGEP